jgi:hypothetical protein
VEDIEFWMNFVVENSNKLQKFGIKTKIELSVFTLVANNTCYVIYPWRKVICFVLSWWYLPNHNVLGYIMGLIIKMISMNKGALTWFKMFGVMVWTLSIIEPFFHWIKKKPRLKTLLEYGGIFDIIGKPSPSLI